IVRSATFFDRGQRSPDIGLVGIAERGRHHPDDLPGTPVDIDSKRGQVRILSQLIPPESIADDRHVRAPFELIYDESTTKHKLHPKHQKKIDKNNNHVRACHLPTTQNNHNPTEGDTNVRYHDLETVNLHSPIAEI